MVSLASSTTLDEITLAGASPDTGNRGVTALCHSVVWHLHQRGARRINVFDHGRGDRNVSIPFGGTDVAVHQMGAVLSRRPHRPENLWTMRLLNRFGGLGNRGVGAIRRSQAVLDVSAGDSFTDLYGLQRFQTIMYPKWITQESGQPLVLLPQTYGPFRSPRARDQACRVIRNACQAWARDADSFAALRELAGSAFDPLRHRQGVDLAFGLPAFAPGRLPDDLANWLRPEEQPRESLIGVNVSGLISNEPESARRQFGLKADYRVVLRRFLDWILTTTDLRIVLVSHVIAPQGNPENDIQAARELAAWVPERYRSRVVLTPADWSPSELKWLIGQTAWFCGTRMHSTIAALGMETPAAAVSYSLKTRGVFASCGQADQVFDLRHDSTEEIVCGLKKSVTDRDAIRRSLADSVPAVRSRAKAQLDEILEVAVPGWRRSEIHGG